ncbi:conserved hypothetical protein [Prochlorococcus marinus str. MIT 9313]|uniref:Uncharacterized protein n=1 Tax=Prochlorococcus marinus (strain MIT 9313) TaxID=74547 RepID=Q7V433_PROMM|nr:hypothetical protein [Prochlorococcus marinus]CAE22312.1 conserved hypothetical protein [Prochlorococcus marinus str. MIT 9313]
MYTPKTLPNFSRKGFHRLLAIGIASIGTTTGLVLPIEPANAHQKATHPEIQHVSHLDSEAPLISIRLPKSGSQKRFEGRITFDNNTKYDVTLTLARAIRLTNTPLPQKIRLTAGTKKSITINGSIQARNGFSAVGVVYSSSMGGVSTGLVNIEVKNGQFRPVKAGDFGLGDPGSAAIAVPSNTRIQKGVRGYKRFLKGGRTFGKASNAIKGGGRSSSRPSSPGQSPGLRPGSPLNRPTSETLNNQRLINWIPNIGNPQVYLGKALDQILTIFTPKAVAANAIYKGRFVFRTNDDSDIYLPAVGVGVKAVKANQSCTHNPPLASTTADGNGNFEFRINTNRSYKICYFPKNSFLKIGRQLDSELYIWESAARNTIPNARVTEQPVRHDGVFDIWYEAMAFQTSMTDAGIDPARTGNNRIRVKFPSEADECKPGPAWSCAGSSGPIRIAPEHATRHGVMSHELAHQVDNKYTLDAGIPRPAGLGGSHSFYGCYPPNLTTTGWKQGRGMIIREGWANYEMARALGSRGSSKYRNTFRPDIANTWIDSINFDTDGRDCTGVSGSHSGKWADDLGLTAAQRAYVSGLNGSESTVSTILWDFYDTRNDNSDTLHYVSPHYITNMYLKKHPTNSAKIVNERIMKDCKASINKNVTNNGQVCDDIFAQNGGTD